MDIEDRYKLRAIGPVMGRGQGPDQVQECLECGALVTYDGAVMQRHADWHERLSLTLP